MGQDLDACDEISRHVAADARLALAGDGDGLAHTDAGGDGELDGLLLGRAPGTSAGLAGMVDDAADAMADGTGGLALHLAEDGALDLDDDARAMAAVAGADRASLGDAGTAAIIAGGKARIGDGLGATGGGFLERDLEADAHVAAVRADARASALRAHAAEEAVEDVVDAEASAEEIGHVDAAPAEASGSIGIAVTVVVGTLALVGEDGIGLVDLFELLLGIGGVVDVGMELSCELQERPLDRLLVGVALNAEDLVEIAL